MASSSARRIFPISDWAPAHEALYSETDNDSSIDTLPFPLKPRQSSCTPDPSASASSSSSYCAPLPRRSQTTKQRRSMSLPWRPKSTIIAPDALEAKFRDYSLERSHTAAASQLAAATPSSSASTTGPATGPATGFVDDDTTCSDLAGAARGKGKGRISGIFRRASVSIRGLVHRRTSIATDTFEEPREPNRHQRPGHSPSYSHHHIQTTPTSPSTQQSRPTTSHGINATWHRLRQATSFRHSRILYGDFAMNPHEVPYQPQDDIPYSVPRPGLGGEPPVIPRNGGSGARAAAAAWQHDIFPTVHPQGRADMPVLKNKRLTLDSTQTDRESGIGIAVTSSDSDAGDPQDLDLVQSEGGQVLYPCAPEISRIDFIDRLPAELAIQVLAHLDAADLARSSLVSRSWRDMVSSQHIWRESYLREKTGTYATSNPIQPGTGLGVPAVKPSINWKDAYRVTEELGQRWKRGHATSIYLNGHSDSIYCLQFDEQKIITGSRDKTIRIWDMHTLACKLVIGPPEVVKDNALLYDEDGNPTHSASHEPHTGAQADQNRTTSVPTTVSFQTHHKASILCLQYDDNILVTGSSDASCIVYDVKGGYRPVRRLRHHTAAVLDSCFDDKHIVTCSKDISICVWDRETGQLLKQLRGHSGPVNAVQMRGNTVVSCSGDFRVKLWNIDTGKQIREFQGHTKGLACSQFSEDGRYVASAGNDKVIRIWDANTGECLREMKAHESLVRSLHIDSVSGRLISGSYDTDIKVFDMETGRQLLDFPRWHASWVLSAKSDYRRIVSTGQDPKILVMDFGAGIEGIDMLESKSANRVAMEEGKAVAAVQEDCGYI
ncbi:hypothetical protein KVR01_004588 [Diaporthe batatas]|uniref:uncharacterized protein n=1 Tax=Diaporthe batatas TaxID=748121 RepID=UPI001D04183B|nr:uncharacterized protein KVR01_004588 [Diaporthe batatas]KAG8166036.1 hypothetical protein KVR01_004588 [Diaporthe batatas]